MKKFHEKFIEAERLLCGVLFLIITLAGFAQVVTRYLFHYSFRWGDDLILFALVWIVFVSSSVATVNKSHIIVSVLVDAFPPKISKWLTVVSQLAWFVIGAFTIYLTGQGTLKAYSAGSIATNSGFPYWIAMIAMPLGMLLMLVKLVVLMVKTIQGERDTLTEEEVIREEMEK